MSLYELHTHLYGCLQLEDIYWLAERNIAKNPERLQIFNESYKRVYGKPPQIDDLFNQKEESKKRLASYYYFNSTPPSYHIRNTKRTLNRIEDRFPSSETASEISSKKNSSFAAFQCCFDLVIALSSTEAQELQEICQRVTQREEADYCEYRMMFSPLCNDIEFIKKSLALCEAMAKAEKKIQQVNTPINPNALAKQFRVIISLSREDTKGLHQYQLLRQLMLDNTLAAKFLVGIDFCHQEEGYPPKHKKEFFAKVHQDNLKHPEHALAILYHVGESYEDKSVESAVRWIVEASKLGVHRLGHAIALGIPPDFYMSTQKKETVAERCDQIAFEIENAVSLKQAGYQIDLTALSKENKSLQENSSTQEWVIHHYTKERIEQLAIFQDWAMQQIKANKTIIECCPSSNLKIGGIGSSTNHPLRRFLANHLSVVIGSDDPGILQTSLKKEYQEIKKWAGISQQMLDRLQDNAKHYSSGRLSGRIT